MDSDTAARNLKDSGTWLRLVYIVLFAIAFNIAQLLVSVVMVVQFLMRLRTGRLIDRGLPFAASLATYVYEIARFLTWRTDEMPWPFAPWPDGPPIVRGDEPMAAAEPEPRPKPRPRRRRPAGG